MLKKNLKLILGAVLSLLVVALLYTYIVYPAAYVNRVLRWGNADVYDYQKFPERIVKASDTPLEFDYNLDEERVRTHPP